MSEIARALEAGARAQCVAGRVDPDGLAYVGMKPMRCWEARVPALRAAFAAALASIAESPPEAMVVKANGQMFEVCGGQILREHMSQVISVALLAAATAMEQEEERARG